MKRPPLALIAGALLFLAPVAAQALAIIPVTVTLDNPNQVTSAPGSGVTTLTFTGTVTVDPNFHLFNAFADPAYNNAQTNSLLGNLDSAFAAFIAMGSGSYSGALFNITVPAGTPPDFYGFKLLNSDFSMFTVQAFFLGGGLPSAVDGGVTISASAPFSVTVTNGNAVPEGGATWLLLGASAAFLYFARRVFLLKAWPTTG